ncbi:MAG: AbrB/MazE/SpoVT family DNA-binding domain-containing protein [Chloroflexi bacterium]|nr:AbrB/MazE/SpoVT family DNA-binding domain-containing protein [Chloroflexota bacterium]
MRGRVKVSSKHQIALPAEARRRLSINSGDTLIVEVVGDHLLIMREPEDWAKYLEGLGKEIWEGVDPQKYIDELRGPWPP